MKFTLATALLLSSASAADSAATSAGPARGPARDGPYHPTDEEAKAFFPLLMQEDDRMMSTNPDGEIRKFWMRWWRGDADREIRMMNKEMYRPGGGFDHFLAMTEQCL
jgi:hypothetical protein